MPAIRRGEGGRDELTFAEFGGRTDARAGTTGEQRKRRGRRRHGGEQAAVACFALFAKHDQTYHDPI